MPRRVGDPSHHLGGPVPVDRPRLDETREPAPADPLARPDLADQVVAGAWLDPVE